MTPFEKTEVKWNAGRVDRWHAHPTIHGQTVADHTYGVLQWLKLIVPPTELSKRLIMAALDHDIAETFTGDTPYTAKRLYPKLKNALTEAEQDIHERLDACYVLIGNEVAWLKFADLTDMGFYAIRERAMGNGFMAPILSNIIFDLEVVCNQYGATPGMREILNYFIKEGSSWEQTTIPSK